MPKGLIYNYPKSCKYHLIETKTRQVIGNLVAYNTKADGFLENIYDIKPDKDIFYIEKLYIHSWKRNQGWGEYLMDFAKRESHKQGCSGRTFLVAYDYENPPQLFYKKQGFVAVDKKIDEELNKHLERGTRPYRYRDVDMYLPLEAAKRYEVPKIVSELKKDFWQKIKDFFI